MAPTRAFTDATDDEDEEFTGPGRVTLAEGDLEVRLWADPGHKPGSADNLYRYDLEIGTDGCYNGVGVEVRRGGGPWRSAILGASYVIGMDEGSAFMRDGVLYVATGGDVTALEVSAMTVRWRVQADWDSVFSLHALEGEDAFIVHGEMMITRLGLDGTIAWERSSYDLWTGPFGVEDGVVEAEDRNGFRYRFRVADGAAIDGPQPPRDPDDTSTPWWRHLWRTLRGERGTG